MKETFTAYTFQDYEQTPERDRPDFLLRVVNAYRASHDFRNALEAERYAQGNSPTIARKVILQPGRIDVTCGDGTTQRRVTNRQIIGNQVPDNFLFRFVTQENQYLLGNGVTLDSATHKAKLGQGFDTCLQRMGEKALIQGVCWGFWNLDHLEMLEAARDERSGFVALVDETDSRPRLGLHFWRLDEKKPMYLRLFEEDGWTLYKAENGSLRLLAPKAAYRRRVAVDALGETLMEEGNYGGALPVVPLYGSDTRQSVLTPAIKAKMDLYDVILSDFGDNLEKANDVYWVLNNYGGTVADVAEMLETIRRLKAVVNVSDGTGGGSTAEQHAFEVPYEARKTALELLEKAMYKDAMAVNMDELTGGSLTNVAIQTAMTNLELKCDRFEWQCFDFVQRVAALAGIETEKIAFKRRRLVNQSETVADIAMMRQDIDLETALKLNPYIDQEEIPAIMERVDAAALSGLSGLEALEDLTHTREV